jgi:hypothetical protein
MLFMVSLVVLAACEMPGGKIEGSGGKTEAIRITGIPASFTTNNNNSTDPPSYSSSGPHVSYKIFVQISTGTTAAGGNVAEGAGLISGQDSVIMDLYYPEGNPLAGQPWAGTGNYNMAVIISPAAVTGWQDIAVHAYIKKFSSQIQALDWGTSFIDLNTYLPIQVKEIYDGNGAVDGDGNPLNGVICAPGSGITYTP